MIKLALVLYDQASREVKEDDAAGFRDYRSRTDDHHCDCRRYRNFYYAAHRYAEYVSLLLASTILGKGKNNGSHT